MKYKAYTASLYESGDQKGKIKGLGDIDRKNLLIALLEREPDKILLECSGDNYLDKNYEGFLVNAPKGEKFIVEGFEQDLKKIRSASPMQMSVWSDTGFPTIRWEAVVEWSNSENKWKVSK